MSVETVRVAPEAILRESDVRPDEPTRNVGVKWVMIVDRDLGPGLIANATACLAAAVGNAIPRVLGDGGPDASGARHVGLPWLGCTILGADADTVRAIRDKAENVPEVYLADMADAAQKARVYSDYLETLASTPSEGIRYHAISLTGPRKRIDKLAGKLSLLR